MSDKDMKNLVAKVAELDKIGVTKAKITKQYSAQEKEVRDCLKELARKYPLGTKFRVGKKLFFYGYSYSDRIDTKKWLELYESKQINREQFLAALSVTKGEAKYSVGDDVVNRISVSTKSKKSDLKTETFKKPYTTISDIIIPDKKANIKGKTSATRESIVMGRPKIIFSKKRKLRVRIG
jgi:hypothetical protein